MKLNGKGSSSCCGLHVLSDFCSFLTNQSNIWLLFACKQNCSIHYCTCTFHLQESYRLFLEKIPIGIKSYKHRQDIIFSHTVATIVTSFVFKLLQNMAQPMFLDQLMEVGFLVHWESLLSTIGDEAGMLEDFIIAIHDANHLHFQVSRGGVGGG